MENAKQKAIEKAYGEYWDKVKDFVDENGWCDFTFTKDTNILIPIEMDSKFPLGRPKSLSGIETNLNWISINSEDDLPNEQDELYFVYGPNVSIHQCVYHEGIKDYWGKNFSHWQPINKPEKPIY